MFGNPYAERMALEATYEDTATVTRDKAERGPDGLARVTPVDIYDAIICALSKKSDSSAQTDAQQNIRRDMTLYTSPDKDIKAGDTVVVTRYGRLFPASDRIHTFEVVGVPVWYPTHIEVALKDVSIA